MSLVTTAPEATTAPSPMVTPGLTMTPAPSQTRSPMVMGWAYSPTWPSPGERTRASVGWVAVMRETRGPNMHSAPMVMGAESSMMQS